MKTLQDKVYGRLSDQTLFYADREMHEMFNVINLIEDEIFTVGTKNLPDGEFRAKLLVALRGLGTTNSLNDDEKDLVDEFVHDSEANRF